MMACKARITDVAEQVTLALCRLADPAASITVARVYAPDWLSPDYWLDNPSLQDRFTGRRVYVFAPSERQQGPFSRTEDENHYTISVVVMEQYRGVDPEIPVEWVDERIAWVESEVFDFLGDARADPPIVENADPLTQEMTSLANPDLLRQHKLFRADVTVVFRRVEDTRR